MQATVDGIVIAESPDEDVIEIEGNAYFPPSSLTQHVFSEGAMPYICPWKGVARYYDVGTQAGRHRDAAWCYPRHDHRPSTSWVETSPATWPSIPNRSPSPDTAVHEEERRRGSQAP